MKHNDKWCIPELLRIEAIVLGFLGRPDDQEEYLVKSMAFAEEIGACSWQLRAALDLARLWQAKSRGADAKRMLQAIYDNFDDGFETHDLSSASALLIELR